AGAVDLSHRAAADAEPEDLPRLGPDLRLGDADARFAARRAGRLLVHGSHDGAARARGTGARPCDPPALSLAALRRAGADPAGGSLVAGERGAGVGRGMIGAVRFCVQPAAGLPAIPSHRSSGRTRRAAARGGMAGLGGGERTANVDHPTFPWTSKYPNRLVPLTCSLCRR